MPIYILPLYSFSKGSVMDKSGLNTGFANGRTRNSNEVYIPIPMAFYNHYGNSVLDGLSSVTLPSGQQINAKICSDNDKSLMSDPNSLLGEWLFSELKLSGDDLITNADLTQAGFDSVILEDNGNGNFNISRSLVNNRFQQQMDCPDIF